MFCCGVKVCSEMGKVENKDLSQSISRLGAGGGWVGRRFVGEAVRKLEETLKVTSQDRM